MHKDQHLHPVHWEVTGTLEFKICLGTIESAISKGSRRRDFMWAFALRPHTWVLRTQESKHLPLRQPSLESTGLPSAHSESQPIYGSWLNHWVLCKATSPRLYCFPLLPQTHALWQLEGFIKTNICGRSLGWVPRRSCVPTIWHDRPRWGPTDRSTVPYRCTTIKDTDPPGPPRSPRGRRGPHQDPTGPRRPAGGTIGPCFIGAPRFGAPMKPSLRAGQTPSCSCQSAAGVWPAAAPPGVWPAAVPSLLTAWWRNQRHIILGSLGGSSRRLGIPRSLCVAVHLY